MTFDPNATQFSIRAKWPGRRREDPHAIATRLGDFLDRIATLEDSLAHWSIGGKRRLAHPVARADLASLIERHVRRDELRNIDRDHGYALIASSENTEQSFTFFGKVGGVYGYPHWNQFWFHTTPGRKPNTEVATYSLFRKLLLTTIACWQPIYAIADSSDVPADFDRWGWFREAWMTYVPPKLVDRVDLVGIPFSERTPDGGLLLSATDQILRADDPAHRNSARRIAQALQPLNSMLPRIGHPFDWPAESEWMSNA